MAHWYVNKKEKPNCGKCVYWCNINECPTEAEYRKLNKIVPASHKTCHKYKRYTGQ